MEIKISFVQQLREIDYILLGHAPHGGGKCAGCIEVEKARADKQKLLASK